MTRYRINVLSDSGDSITHEVYADSAESLRRLIESKNWVVLQQRKLREKSLSISTEELVLLCQHLQLILSAGLPVYDALVALAEESDSPAMGRICLLSAERIDQGESLSAAFASAKLDAFFLAMVRTGETTGQLPELLGRAADHLQWRDNIKRQTLSALSYPLLVLSCLMGVIPLLFVYLVPQLLGFLSMQDAVLPWYTQWLIATAEFFRVYTLTLTVLAFGFLLSGIAVWFFSSRVRLLVDRFVLKIPLLGKLQLHLKVAQLSEQMGIMYSAGIPVSDALPLAANSLGNRYLTDSLLESCRALEEGQSFHSSLSRVLFPSLFLRLVKIGELSGGLDTTLAQAAKLYGRHAHRRAQKFAAVVGPLVLLFAGGLIIWLVAALILPLYDSLFSMGAGL